MANEEHLKVLKSGVTTWNQWRVENEDIRPDLIGANLTSKNLSGADLSEANLSLANLDGTDFSYANLSSSVFESASMIGTIFQNADLRHAFFSRSDFEFVEMQSAVCRDALFIRLALNRTIVCNTDFMNAFIMELRIIDVDLSKTLGLETVRHREPSTIGIDTVFRSKGKIPEAFLRGCGVPENFIRYIPSLVNSEEGMQFYSCFISYSTADEEFARRLHGRMRDAHLRVWFAPEDMPGGKKLHEVIDEAIRVYDKLLIVLSEASLRSEWVMTELRKARKAERQSGKRKLFPVRLVDFKTLRDWECFDADSGKDLAIELREYFIPDFSRWKEHDQFEAAFARLLKDLKADTNAA